MPPACKCRHEKRENYFSIASGAVQSGPGGRRPRICAAFVLMVAPAFPASTCLLRRRIRRLTSVSPLRAAEPPKKFSRDEFFLANDATFLPLAVFAVAFNAPVDKFA